MGALLVAGYEGRDTDTEHLRGARDLLKPTVHCVIVHSLLDEFSNPHTQSRYWGTLLNASVGAGCNDKSDQLIIVTKKRYNHKALRPLHEGLNMDAELADDFNQMFTWLLHYLAVEEV